MSLLEDLELEKEELAEAKAKDEAMLAGIGDGVVAIGPNQKILIMNGAAKAMLGCTDEDVIGQPYTNFFSAIDKDGRLVPDSVLSDLEAFKAGLIIKSDAFYYVPKNGGVKFPVSVTISPVKLDGQIIGIIDVFRDITREKAIDAAKTEFVSLASHQLRTPLTSVSWYIEMLLTDNIGDFNDKQKQYLQEVYKNNQRMVSLVNALLNVSRLELGTFVNHPEPTDIVKLAEKVIDEIKLQIELKKLKFVEHYGEGLAQFNVDPNMFSILLQNLLSNAIKYTPDEGSVGIDLRVAKRGESIGNQVTAEDAIAVIVSDTGLGIPRNQQDRIFTKLFRADNARNIDTDGTGLGLYIVKSIVDNSGGTIWFESEEHKGTTFYVVLPVKDPETKG